MDSIINQINDPAWWFTTIIVALLVSLAAGYLKDWISKFLSMHLKNYKARRYKKLRKDVRRIRILRESLHLYYAYGWFIQIKILLSLCLFFFALVLPGISYFYRERPEYDIAKSLGDGLTPPPYFFSILSLLLCAMALYMTYSFPSQAKIFAHVAKQERRGINREKSIYRQNIKKARQTNSETV